LAGYNLTKGQVILNIPRVEKSYSFSIDVKPIGVVTAGWSSIIQAVTYAIGEKCCTVGARIPGLFFRKNSTDLHVANALDHRGNYFINRKIPMGKFTTVQVNQIRREDGTYRYSITLDGLTIFSTFNENPQVYENVSVLASNSRERPAAAVIRNLKFITPVPDECK